jgi:hypothetical protein
MANSTLSNVSSWTPPGENDFDLMFERANFMFPVWTGFVFGMNTLLYGVCMYYNINRKRLSQTNWIILIYITIMYGLAVVYFWASVEYTLDMYVNDRNFPGGPLGYATEGPITTELFTGSLVFILINALGDALLVFRCYMVWDRSKLIMILPVLTYIAAVVCAAFTVQSASALQFTLPYFGLSTALNVLLTLMIAGKLLWARRSIVAALGSQHAKLYTSIAAMVIESAFLNAIASSTNIALLSTDSIAANIALGTQSQVMCICPMLILIRVARGRAYSYEAITAASSAIDFNSRSRTKGSTLNIAPPSRTKYSTRGTMGSGEFTIKTEVDSYTNAV